jgi:hypothetical protein
MNLDLLVVSVGQQKSVLQAEVVEYLIGVRWAV